MHSNLKQLLFVLLGIVAFATEPMKKDKLYDISKMSILKKKEIKRSNTN